MARNKKDSITHTFGNESALNMVPANMSSDYAKEMKGGKERFYLRWLRQVKPDEKSAGAFSKANDAEADEYKLRLEKEYVEALDTTEKIIIAQNMELAMIESDIAMERYIEEIIQLEDQFNERV